MDPVIISTKSSAYLAELIAERLGVPLLETERNTFGGGEHYYRIGIYNRNELIGRDVIFVGSTHTDNDFLEIVRVGETLAELGTRRRIFVIPFFGYSTMEREQKPGEVVTAKRCARTLSNIPNTGMGNAFLMLDLHVAGLVHYFEGDCLRRELYAEPVLVLAIKMLMSELNIRELVVGSTDLGRIGWVKVYRNKLNALSMAFANKERKDEETKITHIIGDVDGRVVFMYDDMNRSGKTLVEAAEAYVEHGAVEVHAAVTHCAPNDEDSILLIENSPIKTLITTNSHPKSQHPLVQQSKKIIVKDISEIYANAIKPLLV